MPAAFSIATRDEILSLYATGIGIRTISKRLNGSVSQSGIRVTLRRSGVLRGWTAAGLIRRLANPVTWGELSPERAWVLGLVFGDGSIHASGDVVTITRADADMDILRKAADVLGGGSLKRARGCWHLVICSRDFNEHLRVDFGLTENKAVRMAWPQDLSRDLLPHFVRGLVDSDGCWMSQCGRKSHLMKFGYGSVCRTFVDSMETALFRAITVSPRPVRIQRKACTAFAGRAYDCLPVHSVEYSHLDCLTLGNWVYAGGTEHMRGDRKFATWSRFAITPQKDAWVLRSIAHRDSLRAARLSSSVAQLAKVSTY